MNATATATVYRNTVHLVVVLIAAALMIASVVAVARVQAHGTSTPTQTVAWGRNGG